MPNALYDAMLALSPRWFIRCNDAVGAGTLADASGHALDFTNHGLTLGTTGPFEATKNDAATNTCATCGTGYAQRAQISATIANMATTGVTVVGFYNKRRNVAGADNLTVLFDSTDGSGNNGIKIVLDQTSNFSGGAGWILVYVADAAGNASRWSFHDTTVLDPAAQGAGEVPYTGDGKWHMLAVRYRRADASCANEVFDVFIDGVKLVATSSTASATGTFSDPGASQYATLGKSNQGTDDANGAMVVGWEWINTLVSDRDILNVFFAATYTIGDATHGYASLGLNDRYHYDVSQTVYKPDAVTACSAGDYIGKLVDRAAGVGALGTAALNSAGNATNPKLTLDQLGRRCINVDGVMQNNAGSPTPTLNRATTNKWHSVRHTQGAFGQVNGTNLFGVGYGSVAQLTDGTAANVIALAVLDQPALHINSQTYSPTSTSVVPVPRALPSPGVFGYSLGAGGTLDDVTFFSCGASGAGTGSLATGFYYLSLDGGVTFGSIGGAKGFQGGPFHEYFGCDRPMTAMETAALDSYLSSKWQADQAVCHIHVSGTSIEMGTNNDATVPTDNKGWQAYLSAAMASRCSFSNSCYQFAQSGALKKVGSGTAFGGNGVLISDKHLDYERWTRRGAHNQVKPGADIWIVEPYTNDVLHAGTEVSGNVGPQSVQNFLTLRAQVLSVNPATKIVVILPPAAVYAGEATGTYDWIVAWHLANPSAQDALVRITGVLGSPHPNGAAEWAAMGAQIEAKVAPLLPASSTRLLIIPLS